MVAGHQIICQAKRPVFRLTVDTLAKTVVQAYISASVPIDPAFEAVHTLRSDSQGNGNMIAEVRGCASVTPNAVSSANLLVGQFVCALEQRAAVATAHRRISKLVHEVIIATVKVCVTQRDAKSVIMGAFPEDVVEESRHKEDTADEVEETGGGGQ